MVMHIYLPVLHYRVAAGQAVCSISSETLGNPKLNEQALGSIINPFQWVFRSNTRRAPRWTGLQDPQGGHQMPEQHSLLSFEAKQRLRDPQTSFLKLLSAIASILIVGHEGG